MSEAFRFVVPEEKPSDEELVLAALALLMSDAAARSDNGEFKTAAMVMAIQLHERYEALAAERLGPARMG